MGDLTITEYRSEVVDFTTPFRVVQLAALINRKHSAGLTNLKDLAITSNGPSVGVKEHGATHGFLYTSQHQTAVKLDAKIMADPGKNLLGTKAEGYRRVSKGDTPFAFIGESDQMRTYAQTHPEVVVLEDQEKLYPRHLGIALQKGSPYLAKFNIAIAKWLRQNSTKKV